MQITLENNHQFWQKLTKKAHHTDRYENEEYLYRKYSPIVREVFGIKRLTKEHKLSVTRQLKSLIDIWGEKRRERSNNSRLDQAHLELIFRSKLKRKIIDRREFVDRKIDRVYQNIYRLVGSKWAGGETNIKVSISSTPQAAAETIKVWSRNGKWSGNNLEVTLNICPNWHRKVYRAGLAEAGGLLTTHAEKLEDNLWQASWIEQSKGCNIKIVSGFIYLQDELYFHSKSIKGAKSLATRYLHNQALAEELAKTYRDFDINNLKLLVAEFGELQLSRRLSSLAGNCESGTNSWCEMHGFGDRKFITIAEAYNADPNNSRVISVLQFAVRRKISANSSSSTRR